MDMRVKAGDEIDGFVLGEHVHSGAMGDIYRAHRNGAEFPMIMKIPRVSDGEAMEQLLAFETEAMVLPTLAGPHFPRFVAAGDISTLPYLVLEWIAGESLAAIMKRGPMPVEEVARVGAAISDALQTMHLQDTIHLDLKPENVIVRPDGRVCIIDFGLAHHVGYPDLLEEERRFTSGSTPYVSPEQVLGSRNDSRSDLFALGVILYEAATGELPFGTPASMAGLRDRLWMDPEPPRSIKADVPDWFQEIVLHCIEPDASRRYQRAAHLCFDLRHPSQVAITARGAKLRRAGFFTQVGRWWNARRFRLPDAGRAAVAASVAPVIMAAVDTTHPDDPRHAALLRAVWQVLRLSADFRLICVSIISGGPSHDFGGANLQMEHLIRLRHWVTPLRLPQQRLTMHVMEAANPATALVQFARENHVDLIMIGAPPPDERAMAWWRSVASGVTSHAHCSVHVVRVSQGLSGLDSSVEDDTQESALSL